MTGDTAAPSVRPMTTTTRSLPLLALGAGLAYTLTGAIEVGHDQAVVFDDPADYVIEYAFAMALAFSAAVTALLTRVNRAGARAAWGVATAGHAVLFVAASVTAVRGRESLDPVFPLGVLLVLGAALALTVLTVRGRGTPPRVGIALLAGFVGAMALDPLAGAGSLALAASWIAIARLLKDEAEGELTHGVKPKPANV